MRRRRWAVTILLGAMCLAAAATPALAQSVRLIGIVQWISGLRMQVMTESGVPVAVDLTQAEQSSYRGLRTDDWVLVDGSWSTDRRRVVAREIWRDSGRGEWTQSP